MIITPEGECNKNKKCVMCADDAGNTRASESLYCKPQQPRSPRTPYLTLSSLPALTNISLPPYSIEYPPTQGKVDIRSGEQKKAGGGGAECVCGHGHKENKTQAHPLDLRCTVLQSPRQTLLHALGCAPIAEI